MHAGYAKADNLCNRTPVCGRAKVLPVELENGNVVGLAEACGTLGHHLQHGLQLGRRGADDSQNLGCRRLLLERLGKSLFQLDARLEDRVNSRTRLRSRRTKTASMRSALCLFASQGHLVGTVTGPPFRSVQPRMEPINPNSEPRRISRRLSSGRDARFIAC